MRNGATTSVGDLDTRILATNNFLDIHLTFGLAAGPLYGFPSCLFFWTPSTHVRKAEIGLSVLERNAINLLTDRFLGVLASS